MKPFGSAKVLMREATAARDDVTRAADAVERAARIAMLAFAVVGLVASLALVVAVSKEGQQ